MVVMYVIAKKLKNGKYKILGKITLENTGKTIRVNKTLLLKNKLKPLTNR